MYTKARTEKLVIRGPSLGGGSDSNMRGTRACRSSRGPVQVDDLVFNLDNFTFGRADTPGGNEASSVGRVEATGKTRQRMRRVVRKGVFWFGLCALFVVAGAAYFLARPVHPDAYTGEIKLLYLPVGQVTKDLPTWPLDKEVEILKSSEVLGRAAQEVCAPHSGMGLQGYASPACSGASQRFRDPDELARWVSGRLVADTEITGGTAKVTLRLGGNDPEFITEVLETYVRKYVEYRQSLEQEKRAQLKPVSQQSEELGDTSAEDAVSEQMKKVELQERNCELSLQLMDAQKGSFGGFVPDAGIGGVSSLTRFQEKIVELEIKKRGMAVQYTPGSKELLSIDQEIRGVKGAMRECLVEYLRFLKRVRTR